MSLRRIFRIFPTSAWILPLTALFAMTGCKNDRDQVAAVQAMASALGKPKTMGAGVACLYLVQEQQNRMGCDNLLVPLLHYAPGFPGSQVSRRGMSLAMPGKQPVTVHLSYKGKLGAGNIDAVMQREAGKWKVFSLIPTP